MTNNRVFFVFVRHSLPLLLTTAVLGLGAILISVNLGTRESESQAMAQLEQIRAYYEVVLQEMDALNLMFSTNPEMMTRVENLFDAETLDYSSYRDLKMIRSAVSIPVYSRSYIDSVYVYTPNRRSRVLTSENGITTIGEMSDTGWYASFFGSPRGDEYYAEAAERGDLRPDGKPLKLLRIYRAQYDSAGKARALIVMNLLPNRLNYDYPTELSKKGRYLSIYDKNGAPLLSFADGEETEKDSVAFTLISSRFGWRYVMGIPKSILYATSYSIGALTLLLAFLICAIGLALTYKTNQKEREFLQTVLAQLDAAGAAKLAPKPIGADENIFDYLRGQILRTFLEQDFLKVQKEAMEYRALQTQINPHFLFNTLETINWRAVRLSSGPNDVSRMISLLSKLLKYSLSMKESGGVPLDEELEHTGYYLELQKIRFADRFSVSWSVEEGSGSCLVPRLVFQPLLENCFSHGFRDETTPLRIAIRISRADGVLTIEIRDDGKGIDAATVGLLNEADADEGRGIGFANVKKRVRLFTKGEGDVRVSSAREEGSEIVIRLPAAK